MDTITIFRNHKSKVYCIHSDMTRFSIIDCQLITVHFSMLDVEIDLLIDEGFREVDTGEFSDLLKAGNPTLQKSLQELATSMNSMMHGLEKLTMDLKNARK